MGSLESVGQSQLKREGHQFLHQNRAASFGQQRSTQSLRSRFTRLLLLNKIGYLQWVCTVAVFFSFIVLFQMLLPGSVMEKSGYFSGQRNNEAVDVDDEALALLKQFGGFGIGEDIINFEGLSDLTKFRKEGVADNGTVGSRIVLRFGYRKPKLALVFGDLLFDTYQIQMASVAAALREIGYDIEIFSLEDGPLRATWNFLGFPLNVIQHNEDMKINVDWLNYDGILVASLQAVGIFPCLMQEPFKTVPLVWTIHDKVLAHQLMQYVQSGENGLIDNWKKVFSRATVVVFPNYILPIEYSSCDTGNYFVIPGSPSAACRDDDLALDKDILRAKMDYGADDFVIAMVGSQLMYKGLWLDHALVLQALLPVLERFPADGSPSSLPKIIILAGDAASNYSLAVENIVQNLGYPERTVKHISFDEDSNIALSVADIVIYSSLLEEKSFPAILLNAMCLGKPIVAPDLSAIKELVHHKVNGYLFPRQNIEVLTHVVKEVVSNGRLSLLAQNAASMGKQTARNLKVSENIEGYASLFDHILRLPSEVSKSQAVTEIPTKLREEWQWDLFESVRNTSHEKRSYKIARSLNEFENQWNHTRKESSSTPLGSNENFLYHLWEEQKQIDLAEKMKRREDEELRGRTVQSRGTWDDVYRNARKADRYKNELRERDEGELERTGQPLCIYEPYFGEGTWPFLHRTSLYRGIGLSSKGRRPGMDDVDAPSRLSLLSNTYYRDALSEYGAFFAIANRIDRVHRNAWIGFQSWRLTAKEESLSKAAETSLLSHIQARKHGDTLYFWSRMDMDPRNPLKQDFWTFCDSINAGNCRFAFTEALKTMYGIKHNLTSLPSMPVDGDTWSVMHSWVLPTRSFMEFVMFSRMFVDALDMQFYDEHHQNGRCCLSLSKDKHCYSRVLELLINVWAYHSARRMVYINPKTGLMEEQHKLKSRRGQMWVKWFQLNTLKSMDEELAEEADTEHSKRRWLWPSTGEVFWHGIYEKERNLRNKEKEKRKQKSRDKLSRMRKRIRQKVLGKYVKPPPDEESSNSTLVSSKLLR